jgi:hypothetical protein
VVLAIVTAVVDAGGAGRLSSAPATLAAYRPALGLITGIAAIGMLVALSGLRSRPAQQAELADGLEDELASGSLAHKLASGSLAHELASRGPADEPTSRGPADELASRGPADELASRRLAHELAADGQADGELIARPAMQQADVANGSTAARPDRLGRRA